MEFDILNDILTTTVGALFQGVTPAVEEEMRMSMTSLLPANSMDWVKMEGKIKLEQSMRRLGIDQNATNGRDLPSKTLDQLINEKRKVKNELKLYDSQFKSMFSRLPKREEKEPMRPLYMYYKKLKQNISKRPPERSQNLTQEEIEARLEALKKERSDLKKTLHSFQIEFSRTNNRKIRYHSDIMPVETEYNRYKEIKSEIEKVENMLRAKR